MADASRPNPLDVVVLALICVLLAIHPPNLRYLSHLYDPRPALSPDMLGGALAGISTLLLLLFAGLAFGKQQPGRQRAKLAIVVALGVIYVVLPTVSDMALRHDLGLQVNGQPVSCAHDGGVLQTEAAVRFLLQGISPYSANYRNTEMALGVDSRPELWRSLGCQENPAYNFFPYPPLTILVSVPFYLLSQQLCAWYDQRILYLIAWAVLLAVAYRLPREDHWQLPLATAVALNPLLAVFFVLGMNDILVQTLLLATFFALSRERYRTASLLLGLACGTKQFAWLLVPFYLVHLYCQVSPPNARRWPFLLRLSWPLAASLAVIFLPFAFWDPKGLLHSLLVAQGSVYPFRAGSLGASTLVIFLRLIRTLRDDFPFVLFHVVIVLPVIGYGLYRTWVEKTIAAMLVWYAVGLGLFLFFQRHFAHNYLSILFSTLAVAFALSGRATREPGR